jgi:prepilin-type N-terminal cleavage/methylation domain-containing protein
MINRRSLKFLAEGRGFTLVEVLVALGLAGVVLAILVGFFSNVTRTSTVQNAVAAAQQTARIGLDFIVQEIRMAGLDPLKTAGAGIENISAAGDRLRFTIDRCHLPIGGSANCTTPNPDGDVEDITERVTFEYVPAARVINRILYEGTGSQFSEALIEEVIPNPPDAANNPVPLFTFLDGNGTRVTDNNLRADIRTVIVTLTVREPAGAQGMVARTYSSRVRLRNLGL